MPTRPTRPVPRRALALLAVLVAGLLAVAVLAGYRPVAAAPDAAPRPGPATATTAARPPGYVPEPAGPPPTAPTRR
jgi:hypothetical protein